MTIQQLIPATGWCALFARRLDREALQLWTEPLVAWALVQEPFAAEGEDDGIEQSVVGLGVYGVQGVVPCPQMAGFVRIYVRDGADLEPYRPMAETLITSWEQRDREALDGDPLLKLLGSPPTAPPRGDPGLPRGRPVVKSGKGP
jgi:hypothetical protein